MELRADEKFVIGAVVGAFGGDWRPGENPPDAYVTVGGEEVAVEISTLTQQVSNGRGGSVPRLSEDATALWLANVLSEELRDRIPDGRTVVLTLASPILQARKTKEQLKEKILEHVSNVGIADVDVKERICSNCITVSVSSYDGPDSRKVHGVVTNRNSSPDILMNARCVLEDRIAVKAEKCRFLGYQGALWLALLNDYWLADNDTYREALRMLSLDHPFDKILLVSGSGAVAELPVTAARRGNADQPGA